MPNEPGTAIGIVTGAAGGMGSASAVLLAAAGWPLLLCDFDAGRLDDVAAPLRDQGHAVEILAGDIADPAFPATLLQALGSRGVGAVIHTAGVSPTRGDAAAIFAVNYDASERLLDTVRDRMVEGACAVLIASSSAYLVDKPEINAALAALVPGEGSASLLEIGSSPMMAYPISKRGVIQLVERQATAFGARKARVVSISPGLIDTAMSRAENAASPQMAMMLGRTPLARYGTAEEIASVAAFLCSPAAAFISGCDIKVDGGLLAAMHG